jgi:ribosomal protein L11 methyltransferase
MDKKYFELEIGFSKSNYDKILGVVYLYGIKNILETDKSIIMYFSEKEKNNIDTITRELFSRKLADKSSVELRMLVNRDWDKNWKESIKPVFIKDKIVVYPSWLKNSVKKYKDRILIEIDPKMSFGTGHNETTQLMLELMCDFYDPTDKFVLDYGCGTAVLAIAAVKQGIIKAIAIDIDGDSIENATEYLKINNASKKVKLYKKDISGIKEKNFDAIYANILRNVIEKNLVNMHKKLKAGGKLFVSGVLAEEEDRISLSLKKGGFRIVDKRFKSEWIGIYAVKE